MKNNVSNFKTKTTLLYHYALVLVGTVTFDAMKWTQETPGFEPQ